MQSCTLIGCCALKLAGMLHIMLLCCGHNTPPTITTTTLCCVMVADNMPAANKLSHTKGDCELNSPLHTNMQLHYSSQYNYAGRSQTCTSPQRLCQPTIVGSVPVIPTTLKGRSRLGFTHHELCPQCFQPRLKRKQSETHHV
jgi:hypothetical protein